MTGNKKQRSFTTWRNRNGTKSQGAGAQGAGAGAGKGPADAGASGVSGAAPGTRDAVAARTAADTDGSMGRGIMPGAPLAKARDGENGLGCAEPAAGGGDGKPLVAPAAAGVVATPKRDVLRRDKSPPSEPNHEGDNIEVA